LERLCCSAFFFLLCTRLENLVRAFVVVFAAARREIPAKALQGKKFPGLLKKQKKKVDVTPRVLHSAMCVVWEGTLTVVDAAVVVARTVAVAARVVIVATVVVVTVAVEVVIVVVETVVVAVIVVAANLMPKTVMICSFIFSSCNETTLFEMM
jgi:hypothetical protein